MSDIRNIYHSILILLLATAASHAQSSDEQEQTEIWYQYYNTYHFTEKWMIKSDIALRHPWKSSISRFHLRSGVGYRIRANVTVGAGYLYGRSPNGPATTFEHRFHQEIGISHSFNFLKIKHRLRTEQQINKLPLSHDWNMRHRYQIQLVAPLARFANKGRIEIALADEVMINKGGNADTELFNENRLMLEIAYISNVKQQVSITYTRQFSNIGKENDTRLDHLIWIRLRQTIFRGK